MFEHVLTMSLFCWTKYFQIAIENDLAISVAPVYTSGFEQLKWHQVHEEVGAVYYVVKLEHLYLTLRTHQGDFDFSVSLDSYGAALTYCMVA